MIGVDVVSIERINPESKISAYILTSLELNVFNNLQTRHQKILFLSGRLAAKEAIFKATQNKDYLKFSILNLESGKPYVVNHPEIEISITHDAGIAIAFVLIH